MIVSESILLLAGSAINSIKNPDGVTDPRYGAEAMRQALDVHRNGDLDDTPIDEQVTALAAVAEAKKLHALRDALKQRYRTTVS